MARLTIKDPEVHRMARALAEAHGTSMTEQVRLAIRAQFQRSQVEKQTDAAVTSNETVIQRVRDIVRRNRELVERPTRSGEVGDFLYGENNLPE